MSMKETEDFLDRMMKIKEAVDSANRELDRLIYKHGDNRDYISDLRLINTILQNVVSGSNNSIKYFPMLKEEGE